MHPGIVVGTVVVALASFAPGTPGQLTVGSGPQPSLTGRAATAPSLRASLRTRPRPALARSTEKPFEQLIPFYTFDGLGFGPCFPLFGGQCLELMAPLMLPPLFADPLGVAPMPIPVPPGHEGLELAVQAVVLRGPGGVDSVTSNAAVQTVKGD